MKDLVGFTPYIEAFARLILHPKTDTPLTIGIYGAWGAGKTSFLSQLKERIANTPYVQENQNVKQVWFNAWKYENNNHLWASLLQAIANSLEEGISPFRRWWRRVKRQLTWFRIVRLSVYMLILMIAVISLVVEGSILYVLDSLVKEENLKTLVDMKNSVTHQNIGTLLGGMILTFTIFDNKFFRLLYNSVIRPLGIDIMALANVSPSPDTIENISIFERDFKKQLDLYLPKDGRLIIYIDDLDRCTPNGTASVIEAINISINTERCVFVVGMDHEMIVRALNIKYKEINRACRHEKTTYNYGRHFLKKIIQISFIIPPLSNGETRRFVNKLLKDSENSSEGIDDVKYISKSYKYPSKINLTFQENSIL